MVFVSYIGIKKHLMKPFEDQNSEDEIQRNILYSCHQAPFLCNKCYANSHTNKLLANRTVENEDKVGNQLPGRIRKATMPIRSKESSLRAAIAMPALRGLPLTHVNAALEDAF